MKKKVLGKNPLSAVEQAIIEPIERIIPIEPITHDEPMTRRTIMLPEYIIERLQNASYWTRIPFAEIVRQGAIARLTELESENGGLFEKRPQALTPGRKV